MQTVLEPEEERTQYANSQSPVSTRKDPRASGKVTFVVKSKRVCVANQVLSVPVVDRRFGSITTFTERVVVYEDVLDEEQSEALEKARVLANSLGIKLEVKDISKRGILSRFLGLILRNDLDQGTLVLSFAGKTIESLVS